MTSNVARFTALGSFALAAGLAGQAHAQVSPDGSYQTSIPIELPVLTSGVAPTRSFGYDSSGGNGPLGVGWQLQGDH